MSNNLSELKSFLKSHGIDLTNEDVMVKAMRYYESGLARPADESEGPEAHTDTDTGDLAEEAIEFSLSDQEGFLKFLKKRLPRP